MGDVLHLDFKTGEGRANSGLVLFLCATVWSTLLKVRFSVFGVFLWYDGDSGSERLGIIYILGSSLSF